MHRSVFTAQNDFEHARGLRNSAYAVNLTYDRHMHINISREISIEHPSVGLASLAQLEKWFPLWGERAHSLKLFCMYDKRFEISNRLEEETEPQT